MAVQIGPKKRRTAFREFTDRTEPREAFWRRYHEMCNAGTTLISYYGAGGVGKSSLLKKLMDEIDHKAVYLPEKVSYVHYDFDNGLDVRMILQDFKIQLAKQGCEEFPLFETGDFYYQFSTGNATEADAPKIKSVLEKSTWLNKVKKHWGKAATLADLLVPGVNAAAVAISWVGENLIGFWKENKTFDEDHRDINYRLNEAQMSGNSHNIYKLLPELFARDVRDWIERTEGKKKVLIFFLDTYEALVNETIVTSTQRSHDDWLKSDTGDPNGMISLIPNTLWVIAGRNKLRWDNELEKDLDQHLITSLSFDDSNSFMKKAGIENEALRKGIADLTQGFPIYLDLCVDFYERYNRTHNGIEPDISDFGDSRQKVVERLIKYMDAPLRDMINFLCAINYWTDEIAYKLGRIALPNFSLTLYEQVKNFSFIQPDSVQVEDFYTDIFVFDKTVYSILFAESNRFILNEIVEGEKKYFTEKFKDIKDIDGEYIFHVNFCANLFVRLIDNSDELRKAFDEVDFSPLLDWAKFDVADNVTKLFLEKTATLDNNDGVNFAYFEYRLAQVKRLQGLYQDALTLNQSALDILLAKKDFKDIDVINAKHDLARTLTDMGRYDDALNLQKEVLELRKEILGEKHPDTIAAMSNLARIFNGSGDFVEELTLKMEVLELSKSVFGEKHPATLEAMNSYANALRDWEMYDEVLKLQEEVLKLSKEILGERHPNTITAKHELASTFVNFERYDDALKLQEEVLEFRKEILGERHPDTLSAMSNLARTFKIFGRYEDALKLQEKVLELRKEILGEKHPDTITAMENLAFTFEDLKRYEEALNLQEKVLTFRREVLGEDHLDNLAAEGNLRGILASLWCCEDKSDLKEKIWQRYKDTIGDENSAIVAGMQGLPSALKEKGHYDEALELQEEILELNRESFGEKHSYTLAAMSDLAVILCKFKRYDDALKLQEKVFEIRKENLSAKHSNTDLYYANTFLDMLQLSGILCAIGRYDDAIKVQKEVLQSFSDTLGEDDNYTISVMKNLADTYDKMSNYDEALKLQEKILEYHTELTGENSRTIDTLSTIARLLYNLNRDDEAKQMIVHALELSKNNLSEDDPVAIKTREFYEKIFGTDNNSATE